MAVYGFSIDYLNTFSNNYEQYQILLEHDLLFSKEEFLNHKEEAKNYIISQHPNRLEHVTGESSIALSVEEIAKEMCRLFGYQPLVIDVLLDNISEASIDPKNRMIYDESQIVSENVKQYKKL
jgi:hypothetical protein